MSQAQNKENFQLQIDRREMGKADTLRYNIITFVVEENYDRAIHELKAFLQTDSDYPRFHEKVERYIGYAVDLINAIRAKRKFPGAQFMTMAKQQELNDRFREHFDELQLVLRKIEMVQSNLKIEDVRSTVWVVRAVVHSAVAIVAIAFLLEASRGLGETFHIVVSDLFDQGINWIFTKLHL